jgi:hypothetical protein
LSRDSTVLAVTGVSEVRGKVQGRIIMSPARITMMSEEDIESEFGWSDDMIRSLLQNPASPNGRRKKHTGGYTYGLYKRERVLSVAQSTEGRTAKRQWDETLRAGRPNPGWTTRLGDIGRPLGWFRVWGEGSSGDRDLRAFMHGSGQRSLYLTLPDAARKRQ